MSGLADLVGGADIVVAPGVYDAMSAMVAAQAGFPALYLSGASIAYARLGRPDIGLTGLGEVADTLLAIRERVETPIVVDADTGFGNAINAQRTVRLLERCGATAVQLEDQASPKRCGHLKGKALVGTAEMAGKVRAAVDARADAATWIIARTDAIAVEGLDAALDRAEAYLEAGADMLFVEAPSSVDAMGAVCKRFAGRVPLLANMVEGGATPDLDAAQLREIGYDLAIFPGGTMRAVARLLTGYFDSLREHGSTQPYRDRMLDLDGLNRLLGTGEILAAGRAYDPDIEGLDE